MAHIAVVLCSKVSEAVSAQQKYAYEDDLIKANFSMDSLFDSMSVLYAGKVTV